MTRPMTRQDGFTLVEIVITIAVLAIGLVGVLSVLSINTLHSADPMVQQQAVDVAEAYLDEIMAQHYSDPDGSNAGETRATFDDVSDYDGLNESPHDQTGAAVAGLGGYRVQVTVTPTTLGGVTAKRIDVVVSGPGGQSRASLSAYRTDY